ncbi:MULTISPECIES: hypothetical protein [unclassified Actinotalea]|uniref:hypothetical protein n=1 Tax=unclassified Actinotalea TaxID=2638618 RepID=UPI0015F6815A|nr:MULTISPECIES: hypothetical protein [unclassified Actinotalea]
MTAPLSAADRELAGEPSTAALMRAAQAMHWAHVRLGDLDAWVHANALISGNPEVLVLLHRVRIVGRMLVMFRAQHADQLRRGDLELRAGEVGHDPSLRPQQARWLAADGAVGPGRR